MVSKQNAVIEQELLDDYRVGDFFIETPYRTILGKGVFMQVPSEEDHEKQMVELPKKVALTLKKAKEQGHPYPIVTGAVPFDSSKKACLHVPNSVHFSPSFQKEGRGQVSSAPVAVNELISVPSPEYYMKGVEQGIEKIRSGELDKIVISRSLELSLTESVDIPQLLHNLAYQNKHGYTFATDIASEEQRTTLIGASPELLVSRQGMHAIANPLAGSRPRSKDPVEDQRRAKELLSSPKDLYEHAVVVENVANALSPFLKNMEVPEKPSLVTTETMWHLSTVVKGELLDTEISSFDLAAALQPTPAVCGSPTEKARQAISEIEPFDRGFFTGMVGWCDAEGNGEWVVTIRCAEANGHSLRLFAGAGIVGESKPEEELAETGAKFQTMLRAMGINTEQFKDI
ncbi:MULTISPECIES: isochorismate synthase DhbC [Solibacillus]|uniref:isochorismate synthase n=1 Tax=Solibacillus merdavium TaxID=2762218 RepID=A0ABR8XMP6_9BACL|nr:isochorismate synthase DhbC [Solibacillus merdavium]MBD8033176.1 isochorismate synthase DhbC [Solibacillus merdavium]